MTLNLTDNWQIAKILTDNRHLYLAIQTLYFDWLVQVLVADAVLERWRPL